MTTVETINPPSLLPPMQGLYAQIAVAPAGRLAFISGQAAYEASGGFVGAGDYGAQALKAFENLKAAIAAAGGRPENLVRMTIYVVDYELKLSRAIFGAAREVFGDEWPVTSSVMLGVKALAMPEWLIEVDAIVAL
jgi:enamine deaminase RidA (YjgF/YER057c/UK114 family)